MLMPSGKMIETSGLRGLTANMPLDSASQFYHGTPPVASAGKPDCYRGSTSLRRFLAENEAILMMPIADPCPPHTQRQQPLVVL